MTGVSRRRQWVTRAGLAGSTLGVAAGIIQVSVGTQIPQWSGAKSAPVALGLLTIGLSLVAGWAAIAQRRRPTVEARAACALGMIGPGLLCLSTVGGLWYLPAVLLVVAGVMTVEGWRDTGRAVVENWFRVLLSALGGFEILMAAGASAVPMAVGVVSGLLLMIVPWLRRVSRRVWIGLVVAGTVPFAVLAWTAVVPAVLALVAGAVAIPVVRRRKPGPPRHTPVRAFR